MNSKPIFKIVDAKGRVTIPKAARESAGIESGDVVTIMVGRGNITVRKAIVLENNKMPMAAKIAYAETVAREMSDDALTDLLELAIRLLQERKSKP